MGSLYFDLARAQKAGPEAFEAHMASAADHLEKAAQRDSPGALHALFLKASIPFVGQEHTSRLDGQLILSLQDNLLEAIDRVPEAWKGSGNIVGGIHLLYAREGRVAIAATAREMTYTPGIRRPADHPLYHDLYVINMGDQKKIPHRLQPYTAETDLKRVLYVSLGRIAKLAIRDKTRESLDTNTAKNQAFNWLYDEAAGYQPDTTTRQILDQMGSRLRTEREAFLRRRQGS